MPLLDWLNKPDAVQKVPYRLLEAVPELSVGDYFFDSLFADDN